MHMLGRARQESFKSAVLRITYFGSKLHVLMLCKAVARRQTNINANVLDPGWVPTKMGGSGAPDDLQKVYKTQRLLAASEGGAAKVGGRYLHPKKETRNNPGVNNVELQDKLLSLCEEITGVQFPTR